MSKWILIVALVALNAVLGTALLVRTSDTFAFGQTPRTRANFIGVTGHANNRTYLYILDTTNGRLAAIRVDANNRTVAPADGRNIADDFSRLK